MYEISENKVLPKLRFSDFKGDWNWNKYEDIYSFYPTNSFSRDNLNYSSGKIRNIHYGDIHTKFPTIFELKKEVVPFINNDVNLGNIAKESFCKEGDLVIADASEDYKDIGKTIELKSLSGENVVAGLHTFLARPLKGTMEIGFAGYLMQTWLVRKQVMIIAQGTKVLGIATSRLRKIKLSIPSLPEQQKIASFLTAVDDKIQQLQRKKELLEQYKKGIMQKIFKQEIRFRDDGEEFPEWEEKKLGEIFNRITSKNAENNLNVLTISAQQGLINQEKYFNKSVSAKDVTGYYLLLKGDFAYNKSYSNGYPLGAIKRLINYERGVLSTLYICFRINKVHLPEYFEQYFDSGTMNHELQKIAQEGARNHGLLNMSVKEFFNDIIILAPSKHEQQKIADFLSSIDKKIDLANTLLEKSKSFKKGLLQQMFV